ncbi:MAG: PhzF family phenazine biosynthesis protein [Theionarchaea archaeon]|nr:MAG: hypothetical protein AYK18_04775 [Theionarchaea archaeon DG-70]MBU7010004.1 PhzF family phenazine biosynthesis protein [Theionarchaea archaeon]
MKTLKIKKVHVFSEDLGGGNPAGIVFLQEELTFEDKKVIAEILNPVSETAFISPSQEADYTFQYFTPVSEIEICGHATIGACFALYNNFTSEKGEREKEREILYIETKSGIFPVTLYFKGGHLSSAMMKQAKPEFSTIVEAERVTSILGIHPDDLNPSLPVQVVSTGRPKVMVPVTSLEAVNTLHPDFDQMITFCKDVNATGIHPFTFETVNHSSLVHCRHFAPTAGVNEDPATGNGNAALGAYLHKYWNLEKEEFIAEQGYAMGRPSKLSVKVDFETGDISVGGSAQIVLEGIVRI